MPFGAISALYPESERQTSKVQALVFFFQNPTDAVTSLASVIGYSKRNTERIVAKLKRDGLPTRTGGPRKGQWIVRYAPR